MRDIPKRIIIRLSRIALKQISLFYILHLSICCMISLFFLEKQSEIRNSFTFFEKWKVKKNYPFTLFEKWKVKWFFLSLFSRSESEIEIPRDRDREVKFQNNSREFSRNETLAGYCNTWFECLSNLAKSCIRYIF